MDYTFTKHSQTYSNGFARVGNCSRAYNYQEEIFIRENVKKSVLNKISDEDFIGFQRQVNFIFDYAIKLKDNKWNRKKHYKCIDFYGVKYALPELAYSLKDQNTFEYLLQNNQVK